MKTKIGILSTIVLAAVLSVACNLFFQMPRILSDSSTAVPDSQGRISNGERIYFTATNEDDERISYRGGPDFGGMMMGAYLTCAACHGPEAQGGRHVMHMQVMDAPDIRYKPLNSEMDEHGADEDHADEPGEYTLEDFRLAVVEGQHPDGDPLSQAMPRWNIGDEDLADLFAFLKSLP